MEFGVLGPFANWRPATTGSLTAPKLRGLLTLLLIEEAAVPADQLHEFLTHDQPDHSLTTTHVAVHRLRRWLHGHGGFRLGRGPAGYRLDIDPDLVDAGRFRRLARPRVVGSNPDAGPDPASRLDTLVTALSLWRGQLAADSPAHLRHRPAARRLEQLRREATVELVEGCLAAHTPEVALPHIQDVAGASPFDERLQALLAMTLAACGRQVEALRLIAENRQMLAEELGIEPGSQLREAQLRILRQNLDTFQPAGAAP